MMLHTLSEPLGRLALAATLSASLSPLMAAPTPPLPPPQGPVILQITGQVAQGNVGDEAHLDHQLLATLPSRQVVTSTSVTEGPQVFDGVLVRDVLDRIGADGETVVATALNDYVIDIPMSDFQDFDVILAHTMNGERLSARDKGPLWIVYPRDDVAELQEIRYDYRWVWQLQSLEVR